MASGSAVNGGLFIPMLTIGALIGRLWGNGLLDIAILLGYQGQAVSWLDPGVFALIGAASFTAGVTRLTVSLAVIILEMSNELQLLLPIVVAVIVAKWTADNCTVSLFNVRIVQLMRMPYLSHDLPATIWGKRKLDCFVAADIMALKPVCLPHKAKVHKSAGIFMKSSSHG